MHLLQGYPGIARMGEYISGFFPLQTIPNIHSSLLNDQIRHRNTSREMLFSLHRTAPLFVALAFAMGSPAAPAKRQPYPVSPGCGANITAGAEDSANAFTLFAYNATGVNSFPNGIGLAVADIAQAHDFTLSYLAVSNSIMDQLIVYVH